MKYLVFLLTFILLADWSQITLFVIKLLNPSVTKTKLKDEKMLKTIKDKAGLKLNHIIVIENDKMHGGMSGIPGKPVMFLSSTLLKKLNEDELEYVLLHEAGHFKYHHPIIIGFSQIALIALGIYILQFTSSTAFSLVIGIIFTLIYIKIARITERQAENFAAANMDNPKAMISAVNKFEEFWTRGRLSKLRRFLSWNVSYGEKRKIARKYV